MGQSQPLFVYFCSFLVTISIQIEKKRRWCAWDSNPGLQDGRRRRNHRAMVATICSFLPIRLVQYLVYLVHYLPKFLFSLKVGHFLASFFLHFRIVITVRVTKIFDYNFQWLDSNPGHWVLEATALSTVQQPLPQLLWVFYSSIFALPSFFLTESNHCNICSHIPKLYLSSGTRWLIDFFNFLPVIATKNGPITKNCQIT